MKVTDVKTTLFEYPLKRRRGDAHAPSGRTHQNGLLLEVLTDTELVGVMIADVASEAAIHRIKGAIIGEDPRHVRGISHKLVDRIFKGGNVGLMNSAIGALDIALWDLKAKYHDEPLWRLLGAREPRVRGYASGGDMPLDDAQLAEFYRHMGRLGFRAGKIKIGLDVEDDIRRLAVMRDALTVSGPRPALMVDASEYWAAKQAVRRVTEIEREFDLTWVEEPVQRADYRGLQTVSRHIRSPVAAGENLDNIHQFMPYFDHHAVDIIQFGAGMTGITGALEIADMAYGHGLPVICSDSAGKFMAHVAAAMPNHMMLEVHDDEVEEPGLRADTRIEDGWVVIGDKPGIGLEIDRAELGRYTVQNVLGARSGSGWAGRREGAGLIEVPATAEEKRIGAQTPVEDKRRAK